MFWLRFLIIVLLIAILVSLFMGLFFLYKENKSGIKTKGRLSQLTRSLYVRVSLAGLLLLVIIYAQVSGKIAPHAPWDLIRQHEAGKGK